MVRRHGRRYKELLPALGSDRSIVMWEDQRRCVRCTGHLMYRWRQLYLAADRQLKADCVAYGGYWRCFQGESTE